jgi:dipeptidyl aminopeptidase/acylaminoacyl peptidase
MPPDGGGSGLPPPAPNISGGGSRLPPVALAALGVVGLLVVGAFGLFVLGGGPGATTPPSSLGPTTATSSTPSPSASPSGQPSSVPPSPTATATPVPVASGPILVTVADRQSNNGDIGVLQAGSEDIEVLITAGNTTQASWSPDKSRFVYVSGGGLRLANADGSDDEPLTPAGSGDQLPEWSPDGRFIAFASRRDGGLEIYTIAVGNRRVSQLTDNANDIDDRGATWSPDSRSIAFVSERAGDNDIWVMSASGRNPRNLTQTPDAGDVDPAWSPDGETIVWASTRGSDTLHLFFMNADGGDVRPAVPLTDEPDHDPDWSPDGNFIAFHRGSAGEYVLLATLDGEIVSEVRSDDQFIRFPSWR